MRDAESSIFRQTAIQNESIVPVAFAALATRKRTAAKSEHGDELTGGTAGLLVWRLNSAHRFVLCGSRRGYFRIGTSV
jgi:hypothetical protein